jgi:hypothetical protein
MLPVQPKLHKGDDNQKYYHVAALIGPLSSGERAAQEECARDGERNGSEGVVYGSPVMKVSLNGRY